MQIAEKALFIFFGWVCEFLCCRVLPHFGNFAWHLLAEPKEINSEKIRFKDEDLRKNFLRGSFHYGDAANLHDLYGILDYAVKPLLPLYKDDVHIMPHTMASVVINEEDIDRQSTRTPFHSAAVDVDIGPNGTQ